MKLAAGSCLEQLQFAETRSLDGFGPVGQGAALAWTPGDLESGDDAMIATALIPLDLKNRNLEQTCNQSELFWYAVYTSANHEKRVASQLEQRAIESFLPLYDAVHRWRDGKMRLQLPLFPSYVFVRMFLRERVRVLQVPGVARLVGFGERPWPCRSRRSKSYAAAWAGG